MSTTGEDGRAGPSSRSIPPVALLGFLGLAVPFVVALAVLAEPRWYPSLEYAQTELHVRAVGTDHTPLTGLIGRLGRFGEGGSHPGPLSFFALAPAYRLAGASSWALLLATAVLHLAAMGTALWLFRRRGGRQLLVVGAAALAVLTRFYGPSLLTEPWNPYLPLLWWIVFLLAVWSVLERDTRVLPVAVVAGSLCAQTHVSYLGPTLGLGALAALATVLLVRSPLGRGAVRTWPVLLAAGAVGLVLWLPAVIEEVRYEPGNLSVLLDFFREPPEAPIGPVRGVELVLADLDPVRLLTGSPRTTNADEPGGWPVLLGSVHLVAWLASALRRRLEGRWSHLDSVIGAALVLAAVVASRIHGPPWAWLLLWVWGLCALMAASIVWGLLGRLAAGRRPATQTRVLAATAAVVVVASVSIARFTAESTRVEPNASEVSSALGALVPGTLDALADAEPPDQRYLVRWIDPHGVVGALKAFGMVDELERAGFEVALEPNQRLRAAPHLAARADGATAAVTLVTGSAIDAWDGFPGIRRVAAWDPRTPEQRDRQERLERQVATQLEDLRLTALRELLDISLLATLISFGEERRVPAELSDDLQEVLDLGTPSAVFLGPPEVAPRGG